MQCKFCKTEVAADVNFCPKCGFEIERNSESKYLNSAPICTLDTQGKPIAIDKTAQAIVPICKGIKDELELKTDGIEKQTKTDESVETKKPLKTKNTAQAIALPNKKKHVEKTSKKKEAESKKEKAKGTKKRKKKANMGRLSLIFGTTALITFLLVITGIVFGALAIIFGLRGYAQGEYKESKEGITNGAVALVIDVLILIIVLPLIL